MKKLLDIGCGPGTLTNFFYYEKKKSKYEIYGIDIDQENIKNIKKNFPAGRFMTAAAEKIPYPDNYFDEIFLKHVLEHVRNPKIVLLEAKRLLKKGKKIIVAVPHEKLELILNKLIRNYVGGEKAHHQRIYSQKHLIKILEECGFKYHQITLKRWPLFLITLILAFLSKITGIIRMQKQSGVFIAYGRNYLLNKRSRKIGIFFYNLVDFMDNHLSILNNLFPWEIEAIVSKKA